MSFDTGRFYKRTCPEFAEWAAGHKIAEEKGDDATETDAVSRLLSAMTPELCPKSIELICVCLKRFRHQFPLPTRSLPDVSGSGSIYIGSGGVCVFLLRVIELLDEWTAHYGEEVFSDTPKKGHSAAAELSSKKKTATVEEVSADSNYLTKIGRIKALIKALAEVLEVDSGDKVRGECLKLANSYAKLSIALFKAAYGSRLRRITLLEGISGAYALSVASLCLMRGSKTADSALADAHSAKIEERVQKLLAMAPTVLRSFEDDELLYGKCGYLSSLMFVCKYLDPSKDRALLAKMRSVRLQIVEAVLSKGSAVALELRPKVRSTDDAHCPLMWVWHDSMYLGGAHGVSGILLTILQNMDCIEGMSESARRKRALVFSTIDYCRKHFRFESGNYGSSLRSLQRTPPTDKLVHWCHGAPSFVHLFLAADRCAPGASHYLEYATDASRVLWGRGLLRKGPGLCHGVAGNGYGLLACFRQTKELQYLYEALEFLRFLALETRKYRGFWNKPDRPTSLFEGSLAAAFFALDCLFAPESAKFPCFEF